MSHPSGGLLKECYRLQNSGSLKWYYLTAVSTNIHNLDPVSHIQHIMQPLCGASNKLTFLSCYNATSELGHPVIPQLQGPKWHACWQQVYGNRASTLQLFILIVLLLDMRSAVCRCWLPASPSQLDQTKQHCHAAVHERDLASKLSRTLQERQQPIVIVDAPLLTLASLQHFWALCKVCSSPSSLKGWRGGLKY
jgi:hypothetical protein